jgi:aryl-alcohol dehydrogenase-like predicted oxidoreductase
VAPVAGVDHPHLVRPAVDMGTVHGATGRAIKEHARRDDIILATKVHQQVHEEPGGSGCPQGDHGTDRRLADRLGTDYVDLYQIHRLDPDTPVEETMAVLHDVVKAGKAGYLGASSMGRGSSPRCST